MGLGRTLRNARLLDSRLGTRARRDGIELLGTRLESGRQPLRCQGLSTLSALRARPAYLWPIDGEWLRCRLHRKPVLSNGRGLEHL